ncbi:MULTISPECIES: FAD-dependent oxidoreductase [Streptomyces]|uniref:ferredoxin--NADP(+) reductase n=2 Tax=Streptomyces TaxID=1883 RepID=A0A1D8G006_9ACTN|nr:MULTISPECIES: FAD-dependent oxidoreductase [Streptomyces]AOT58781.1 NADPH-ferredoxin reductase FprA [Streptomyces rubrolavendulae]KAF0649734.1 FAD-dependent pyridine nucleotide-disulfide oxidoreductase [Streptomyces fradiae ATCC 10745 = DSM 40063]OSY50210.1 NADPH-ferredoxin reductase FprA [Streptomyces fradiae ATCC 10745 = DSM 40063]QEV12147.1 pyridine nucleotide-disulfide oxidoreductase [Streptomyces fradiae ATCC 10745 = DSM 40063]
MPRPLRVAIVGAGPAGIYAADALLKSEAANDPGVSIDLFERMPAPFGLIRYGVAPDHPRIKGIVTALHQVLDKPQIRLFGNVSYPSDITLDDLRAFYDAVIFSTGAEADRELNIPGVDLDGSYGAAEFVSWYDGHPDVPRTWPLEAEKVAVLGVGNVALDVARVLAKTADELLPTEIPANVYEGLKANKALEVHVFGRRGPAQAKFSPMELRELDHSPSIEVIVNPEDIDYDQGSIDARRSNKQVDMVAKTLENWAIRDVGDRPHKLFLHFFESPAEILGEDGRVVGLRTERTELDGTGNVRGTGEFTTWDVQAVYRAVGYLSEELPKLPWDAASGTVPDRGGRVVEGGEHVTSTYVTGWIRRGPIGLIGHTKGDANETVANLLEDHREGRLHTPEAPQEDAVVAFLEGRGVAYTTWDGWYRLDAAERALGEAEGRERIKIVEREEMLRASGVEA